MQLLHGHKKAVNGVAFSRDGSMLASAASDGVCVWDLGTGKPRWHDDVDEAEQPAFSPDGRWLAAVGLEFGLWHATTGKPGRKLRTARGEPMSCAFSQDGKHLAAGSDDDLDAPRVSLYPVGLWKPIRFPIQDVPIQCCTFRPDSQVLATAGKSRISLVDVATGQKLAAVALPTRHDSSALAWSPDGRLLLHAAGATISIRDGQTLAEIATIHQPSGYFLDIAFHPGGSVIATARKDATIQFWDTANWKEMKTFAWDIGGLRCVAFAQDGLRAACGGDKGKIMVWDVDL
jgi:WD40 repeat protein